MWYEHDGNMLRITSMYDADGQQTDDRDEMASFVAGPLPDGTWIAVRCLGDIQFHDLSLQ